MPIMSPQHPIVFGLGLLGNVIAFMVYLAPLPTFIGVYRKKSTEGFHSLPYVCGLFSALFWLYYGLIKPHCSLLITINSAGCIIETFYLAIYAAYAPPHAKRATARLLMLLNMGVFGSVLLFTLLFTHDQRRILIVGWTSSAISVTVFAAPLSVLRLVICTKSVEFMPFYLSFFLTINATIWFAYGFLLGDMFIALPNVLGFLFGLLQMTVYFIYRNAKQVRDEKPVEHGVVKLNTLGPSEVHPIDIQVALNNNDHKPRNTIDSCNPAAIHEKVSELAV